MNWLWLSWISQSPWYILWLIVVLERALHIWSFGVHLHCYADSGDWTCGTAAHSYHSLPSCFQVHRCLDVAFILWDCQTLSAVQRSADAFGIKVVVFATMSVTWLVCHKHVMDVIKILPTFQCCLSSVSLPLVRQHITCDHWVVTIQYLLQCLRLLVSRSLLLVVSVNKLKFVSSLHLMLLSSTLCLSLQLQ